jgi:TolA-binding protein
MSNRLRSHYLFAALVAGMVGGPALSFAQQAPAVPAAAPKADTEESRLEFKANDMLNKGMELLDLKQDERAVKMIASVPQMFPKSKARLKAYLALGKYYTSRGTYELAIKQFEHLTDAENPDQQAEGLYQTGICFYNLGNYDKAFMSLRRVTSEFPWSVFANESYYYIGQCHFKLGRWAKAVEALEMVGTSVDPDAKGEQFAEAGQRLYVKIYDKDLVVQRASSEKISVLLTAKSGDKETISLEPLGRSGEYYIGSLPTALGTPKPGDGTLQIIGGDSVTVDYIDKNTESGKQNVHRVTTVKMVSTAAVGFTDGAYREYTKGVFGDQDCFLRIKDLDRDVSDQPDTLTAKVYSQYKVEKDEAPADKPAAAAASTDKTGIDLDQKEEYAKHDEIAVTLTEIESHGGVFAAKIVPHVVSDAAQITHDGKTLSVMKGDEVVIEYVDEANITGESRTVAAKARLLIGQIQDVKVEHRVVDSLDLKARKDLIEAKIFLKLGQVFKEVGLTNKASEKATEGLDRVESVIATSLKASLDRSIVEDAFSVKWDLLLVQDKMGEAIEVCRSLTELFPDSSLVDKALLKIGLARMESENPADALGIFYAVIALPKSQLKAEAQYEVGVVLERLAIADGERYNKPPVLTGAMQAYKQCADQYPTSPFAGEALDKIASYYITAKDYPRAIELMEQVMQDYPDASFLDKMLLKWVIAAYRSGNYAMAKQKVEQLLSEYPNSKSAEKGRSFLKTIDEKLQAGGPPPKGQ